MNRRTLSLILVMLMLSNSSLALEIITHDSHQHVTESGVVAMQDAAINTGISETPENLSAMPAMDHGDEDCVCDDICCINLVEFAPFDSGVIQPGMADSKLDPDNLYQSVSLNLLLHPPTT